MIFIKIKVFYPVFLVTLFLFALCIACFVWMMCTGGYADLTPLMFFIVILFLLVLPTIIFFYSSLTMANTIKIDENGVTRYRFGKIVKQFQWPEIKTLSCTNKSLFTGWCYISNEYKKYNYYSLSKMRLDRSIIYFHLSQKAIEALSNYCPNKEIIEKTFIN